MVRYALQEAIAFIWLSVEKRLPLKSNLEGLKPRKKPKYLCLSLFKKYLRTNVFSF